MDPLLIVLRLLHITLGVAWAGTIFFVVLYLEPSVRAAGPAGGAVMKGLQERRLMVVLPIVAFLTLGLAFLREPTAGGEYRANQEKPDALNDTVAVTHNLWSLS